MRHQEIINEQNRKELQKQKIEEEKHFKKLEKMKSRELIENLKITYMDYTPNPNEPQIELRIRLPSGKKVSQNFEKSKKISFIKNFILQLENNGITDDMDEDLESGEEVDINLMYGFPRKQLDPEITLGQVFGDSSGETITVVNCN